MKERARFFGRPKKEAAMRRKLLAGAALAALSAGSGFAADLAGKGRRSGGRL